MPLTSHEVRWFFPGELAGFPELQHWIETVRPFPHEDSIPPAVSERRDDIPDVHVLIPGADDLCLRWRDGHIQVKGRTSRLGLQRFARRFYGAVDGWATWSYRAGDLESGVKGWLSGTPAATWDIAEVRKTRRVRRMRLGALRALEVTGAGPLDRGLDVELTDLEVGGRRYCSLALKAYPNDPAMPESFSEAANAWLSDLANTRAVLAEHQSMGYPEFLRSRRRLDATTA